MTRPKIRGVVSEVSAVAVSSATVDADFSATGMAVGDRSIRGSLKPVPRAAYSGRMSNQTEPDAGVPAAKRCRTVRTATSRCRCAFATASRRSRAGSRLLILQHPQEQDRALGTARLTALHFQNAVLKIGLSWPSLSKALGRPVPIRRAGPCSISVRPKSPTSNDPERYRRHQSQRRNRGQPARHPEGIEGIVCSTAPGARPRRCGGAMPGC